MPSVVIRVDASAVIGSGHVIRCLTLASGLRAHGMAVSFVCREHAGNLCNLIEQLRFPVSRLAVSGKSSPVDESPAHAAWLGGSWQDDARETRLAIDAMDAVPNWLVVDHYALDRRWENALRGSVRDILIIDDLADRMHGKGFLLDQNLVDRIADRYKGKMPAGSCLLLGPDYALLQPLYASLHDLTQPRKGPIRRVLLYFGGDAHGITRRALGALLRINRPEIQADVVVAEGSPDVDAIRRQIQHKGNVRLHVSLPSLATLMAQADLAIGAGGVATWERLCLGLPSLVVTVAENQRAIAEELGRRDLIRYLGHHDLVDEAAMKVALNDLLSRDSDEEWSRRCSMTVDGRGAVRVAAVLATNAATPLLARNAVPGDEARLLDWSNDPATRENAFCPERIAAETHRAWFRKRLQDSGNCHLYIVETGDAVELGTVRFERSGAAWEVHFSLALPFRGRGLGRRLVETAMLQLRTDNMGSLVVLGQVKEGNQASRKIFEALAFEAHADSEPGMIVYWRTI